jgi:neopullulanase
MKRFAILFLVLLSLTAVGQPIKLDRVEPPFWWTGFKNQNLQLLVYGKDISKTTVELVSEMKYKPEIVAVHKVENPNYLFIDLKFPGQTEAGFMEITFSVGNIIAASYNYEIKARAPGSANRKGFNSSDVIYLITPDRFANGDTANDSPSWLAERLNRSNKDGRHGGDIKGIADHLDYIDELGATAIWINPLLENNQPTYSYHGYSITDYYKTDPRFGSNADYLKLAEKIHDRGMKLIMDQVFNHCGSGHWWMNDLPSGDWINVWPEFTRSTYRAGSVTDPYVSETDSNHFVRGWFDKTMPDLNQLNPYLKNYLIQNSIWWIEYAGLDGIRQDTHPYPFKDMMAEWGERVLTEYPGFNLVGECWMNYPATVAYWQKDANNRDGYNSNLPSVFDFPMQDALIRAFVEPEGWNTGILRLYEILAQDFSYPNPSNIVVFADNHDVNRYFDTQSDDIRKYKMAMTFIMTTRGTPQIFYGGEILMTTGADKGHGIMRGDFPGGWPGDSLNAFTANGRTPKQQEMFSFMKKLLNYRKANDVLHNGRLLHFIPQDGIYVYFRINKDKTVMVAMNNNEEQKTFETDRYNEVLKNFRSGRDILSGQMMTGLSKITLDGKSALVLELGKE